MIQDQLNQFKIACSESEEGYGGSSSQVVVSSRAEAESILKKLACNVPKIYDGSEPVAQFGFSDQSRELDLGSMWSCITACINMTSGILLLH